MKKREKIFSLPRELCVNKALFFCLSFLQKKKKRKKTWAKGKRARQKMSERREPTEPKKRQLLGFWMSLSLFFGSALEPKFYRAEITRQEPKKEKKGKKKEGKSGDRESLRNGVERF